MKHFAPPVPAVRAAVAPARAVAAIDPVVGRWGLPALIAAAILLRLPYFGHPSFDIDEEYYLLVGDRMLHGALPYVDIWDRKPIGLFLIYAAIRAIGGQGFVPYQLAAAICAGGTAWIVARLARAVTGGWPAAIAGLAYLLWIETLGGGGGQSPVFYNLPVAGAAWATWAALAAGDDRRRWHLSLAAMALAGIAIQIKYTAAVETALFGLLLAIAQWRSRGAGAALPVLVLAALAWVPTLAAWGYYAARGAGDAFVFANFTSIFLRRVDDPGGARERLAIIARHLLPLACCGAGSAWLLWRQGDRRARRWLGFMAAWLAAALAGFASVGAFFCHYALPLFVPLAVAAAPIFARQPIGTVLAALCLWIPFSGLAYPDFAATARAQREMARLVAHLPADVGRHCLFAYEGPPSLYLAGKACVVSRFVFPDHLESRVEAAAIGIDPVGEVRRILARRPAAITIDAGWPPMRDPRSFAPVRAALARDYRLTARATVQDRPIALYVRIAADRPARGPRHH